MPVCDSESVTKLWNGHEGPGNAREWVKAGSTGSSIQSTSPKSPSSPESHSPAPSPTATLKRSHSSSSAKSFIQEPFIIQSDRRTMLNCGRVSPRREPRNQTEESSLLVRIIGWYPCFLLRIIRVILLAISEITFKKVILFAPTLWLTAWIWLCWKACTLPLVILKWMLAFVSTPLSDRYGKKRTVLINGGSTVQALHLARNFYSAGARVIVCEIEGVFSLTRFSMAVSKFYTVPKPNGDNAHAYIRSLCNIVEKEDVIYYIPVCATTSAYYDAVAKPYLELLGCNCFCPGVKEAWCLDDSLEIMRRCESLDLPTPTYCVVTSRDDVMRLYDDGTLRAGRNLMASAGPAGVRERVKFVLPTVKSDFRLQHEISESRPWIVIRDVVGEHYVTCTTLKQSRIVANVTCRVDKETNGLIPVEHKEIIAWLEFYFSRLRVLRPIDGHVSFRFAVADSPRGSVIPLGARVGISLPYVCHTSAHPRVVWKQTCRHFVRQSSGPLVIDQRNLPQRVRADSVGRLIGTVLDKREALFVFWDPLPYCAYYHMQLPFRNVIGFVRRRQDNCARTMAAPVH